jgi:hypothetical protein
LEVDQKLVLEAIRPLARDAMGRIAVDEAREVALVIGADTLITGTVASDDIGYAVDAGALDIQSGRYLATIQQQFDGEAMREVVDEVRDHRTYRGMVFRSVLMPGWGQVYNGDVGRGIIYNTLFLASLAGAVTYTLLGSQAEAEYDSRLAIHRERREDANVFFARSNALYISAGVLWLTSLLDILATGSTATRYDVSAFEVVDAESEGGSR